MVHGPLSTSLLTLAIVGLVNIEAFNIPSKSFSKSIHYTTSTTSSRILATRAENDIESIQTTPTNQKTVGLITFDLDDTLFPIGVVIDEANKAFARAMERFGYEGIKPSEITEVGKIIREELPPIEAAALSHTEIRSLAIRRVMEEITFQRKLVEIAEDFSTDVENLNKIIVQSAQRWAAQSVSPSTVDAVLTAWEMERHHASERHLYPEVIDVLKEIKEKHPDVIIGAVTDGKANPLLMTFTLMSYFDFCMSWEDDQGARANFFKELDNVEGNAELTWIYKAALEKANERVQVNANMIGADVKEIGHDSIWIHVGDDLAYDVGGAASCGAKTVYVELNKEKYGQTARFRFENTDDDSQPSWSTSSKRQLDKRMILNEAARSLVDKTINFLTRLPEAVDEILEEANKE